MSSQIQLVASIFPKPGNTEKVAEGLLALVDSVKGNEPGVLSYQLHKQVNITDGQDVLVFIETFKDKEALAAHQETEYSKAAQAKAEEEQLLALPTDIKILVVIGGFGSRA